MAFRRVRVTVLAIVILLIVAGCNGGKTTTTTTPTPSPTPKFTLGGTVEGLTGTLVLQNNGVDDKTIIINGTFSFANSIATGGIYNVTVKTHPAGQGCAINNGTGTIASSNISNVTVLCMPQAVYAIDNSMVLVNGGSFSMGDNFGSGRADELPVHTVTLSNFYIGKYEVTQDIWVAVMGSNPSVNTACGGNCPVDSVTWDDVQVFITNLNAITKKTYRLPTEAEFEYAASSGGQLERYAGTSDSATVVNYAWYTANAGGTTHLVGQKLPNGLGLYDMGGNIQEWCSDWYGAYSSSPVTNPTGPSSGTTKLIRGASIVNNVDTLHVAYRGNAPATYTHSSFGFRLAKSIP